MSPDERKLHGTQDAGLAQHLRGNGDLAHIVHQRGKVHAAHVRLGQVQLPVDGLGESGHAPLVPRRVGIAQLHHGGENLDGLLPGLLKPPKTLAQLRLRPFALRNVPVDHIVLQIALGLFRKNERSQEIHVQGSSVRAVPEHLHGHLFPPENAGGDVRGLGILVPHGDENVQLLSHHLPEGGKSEKIAERAVHPKDPPLGIKEHHAFEGAREKLLHPALLRPERSLIPKTFLFFALHGTTSPL